MLKDFREFVMKGNVIDLAVAVIIGGAFGAIISSLVDDIITPLLLAPAMKAARVENISSLTWNAVKYGNFIAAVLKFLLIAFVLFLVVKLMTRFFMTKKDPPPPVGPTTEELLTEIRDLLKRQQ